MPYGEVCFKEPIDLRGGMDFAGIVKFGHKEVCPTGLI